MTAALYTFANTLEPAGRLADALGLPCRAIHVHRFPDGESLVRLDPPYPYALIYQALDRPNDKLIELMLAASVLREAGAAAIILIAPYLPYMRQDIAFQPGEAVSQRVVGRWLAGLVDGIVTVNPHLHRTGDLAEVFPGIDTVTLSAAGPLADYLRAEGTPADTVIVGPDEESAGFVREVAQPLGLDGIVGTKLRHGDRDVAVTLPAGTDLAGRPAVIVDDVISSGGTIIECARALQARGVRSVSVLAVHALFSPEAEAAFRDAGIDRVASCNGVPHPSNRIALAPFLVPSLRKVLSRWPST